MRPVGGGRAAQIVLAAAGKQLQVVFGNVLAVSQIALIAHGQGLLRPAADVGVVLPGQFAQPRGRLSARAHQRR